jgi:hypothetical protein
MSLTFRDAFPLSDAHWAILGEMIEKKRPGGQQMHALARACELLSEQALDLDFRDCRRVERFWEYIEEGNAAAYGFVAERHDGRRLYLEYSNEYQEGKLVEHAGWRALQREPHPDVGAPHWHDDPELLEMLNEVLRAA